MSRTIFLFVFLLPFYSFTASGGRDARCHSTKQGPAIDWVPGYRLKWSDFKSYEKKSPGFAIATSTCGFGYEAEEENGEIRVNVYVRFFCYESWRMPGMKMKDVLKHEQLHFDICELYGRRYYAEILQLRKNGGLTFESLDKTLDRLREEYERVQDRYDLETDHSTNTEAQHRWERMVVEELKRMDHFAAYKEF